MNFFIAILLYFVMGQSQTNYAIFEGKFGFDGLNLASNSTSNLNTNQGLDMDVETLLDSDKHPILIADNIDKLSEDKNQTDTNASLQLIIENGASSQDNVNITTIDMAKFQEFKNATFKMPNNAKAITTISIRYIDELGMAREKVIDINKNINWMDDLIIQKLPRPVLSETLDVSVTSAKPGLLLEHNRSATLKNGALIELPLETLKFDDGLRFAIREKQLKIITEDRLKDSFMQPSRGIFGVELYRDDMNMSAVGYAVNKGGFGDINVTKERFYYTILISVDGNFTIVQDDNGYTVTPKTPTIITPSLSTPDAQ